jgi:hypothetical protein
MSANPTSPARSPMDGAINAPIILATYAASSLVLGYGFANPVIDGLGLISTAVTYLVTRKAVNRFLTSAAQ